MTRVFQSIVSSVLAAAVGLGAVLILGVLWWEVGRGLPGMVLGSFCGAVCAQQIRKRTTWPSSVLAASLGAGIASFLAIATGEAIEPGSLEWAARGGLYGATVGLPVSAVLGPLGVFAKKLEAESQG